MTMLEQILPQFREAILAGPNAVVRTAATLSDPELGLLVLWLRYVDDAHLESGRVLAIESGKLPNSSVARACRLWLMARSKNDLGIIHTLLGYFHRDLAELRSWPSYLVGETLDFLRAALNHQEVSVRAEVLSVLTLAAKRELLAHIIHAEAAIPLGDAVRKAVAEDADAEEFLDLAIVEQYLRAGSMPQAPALDSRALQRIALDLMDSLDRYPVIRTQLAPLVELVQRRALLDDAGVRVRSSGKPLQTLRVKAQETATRLVQAFLDFGEATVKAFRDPDFAGSDAPDYGQQMVWAPAASVPMHLSYANNDARRAFEMLERLVSATDSRRHFDEEVSTLPPEVAEAFLRLLQRLRQHDGHIEVVLTDPHSVSWQRSLLVGPDTLGHEALSSLMKHARSAARGRGIYLPADQVPQANSVHQVFQAVDAILQKGIVTFDDIDGISSQRQVNYYKQGARVLEFLDSDNQPTGRARSLIGVPNERRLALTAIYFEDSPIGRAWRAWAGLDHLAQVDPSSAQTFLETCAPGLTGSTPPRRASTLRAWYEELMPHHPIGGRSTQNAKATV